MSLKLTFRRVVPVISVIVSCATPALAKHAKQPPTNIFTPPAEASSEPSFSNNKSNNKTATVPKSLLDGAEEPRWDIIKSLPDLSSDQTKSINKVQQETQKTLTVMRNQMNEAQQELKELKAHKTPTTKADPNPAIAFLNPDGKPYMGPLLGTQEMGMDPAEESMEDVQAQIDGLKDKIKDNNMKAASLAKAIFTPEQLNELELMRQGRLVVTPTKNALVDSPSEPATSKSKSKRELASENNAGGRVLRTILSSVKGGLRTQEQI